MFRVGIGFDVHPLLQNRELIIGGVHVPYYKGLFGYSDGDVLTHAICDALLGAMAMKDIGHYFPPGDPQWEDVSSLVLLQKVAGQMSKRKFKVENIDSVIIAERPQMKEYIPEMINNIANALQIDVSRVNVKATTTEKLGFEGRGEGISAQAVCLLSLVQG